MDALETPTPGDEFASQVIEQLGVSRRRGGDTKVAGCADEPPSEMVLPDSVDDHACRQRVVGRGDPIGEDAPPTAGGRTFGCRR